LPAEWPAPGRTGGVQGSCFRGSRPFKLKVLRLLGVPLNTLLLLLKAC
jgi:hypothetical protein